MTLPRTWHTGEPTETTPEAWAALVPHFLGCGFRIPVPADPAAVAWSQEEARRTAALFGAPFDPAPWTWLAESPTAVEVVGGWQRGLDRNLGDPWTRITAVDPAPDREAVAAWVPWWYGSAAPTAGYPVISRLEADRAAAGLSTGEVGIWADHEGRICTTTAGPLVLRTADGWVRPDDRSNAVLNWAYLAAAAGARPVRVEVDLLADCREAIAIDALGTRTRLAGITALGT